MPNLTNFISPNQRSEVATENEMSVSSRYEGSDTLIAAACYLYFVSAAVLVLRHDNSEFVEFHGKQAFVLLVMVLLASLFLPFAWKIVANVVVFALSLYGGFGAFRGQRWGIPYLTSLANHIDL